MDHETPKAIVVGPWGGHGGTAWDDGSFSSVREITLVYGRCIDSMKVVYDNNGQFIPSSKAWWHWGIPIKLQFPDEFLTSVCGYICPVVRGGSPVIRSFSLKRNRRTFGPYGVEEGMPFSFPLEGGKIVGLKGRCGWYLDSIGFYITLHMPQNHNKPTLIKPFKLDSEDLLVSMERANKIDQSLQSPLPKLQF